MNSPLQPPHGWTIELLIDVWDFAYEITEDRGGKFRIARRFTTTGGAFYADTVDGARALIAADYYGAGLGPAELDAL